MPRIPCSVSEIDEQTAATAIPSASSLVQMPLEPRHISAINASFSALSQPFPEAIALLVKIIEEARQGAAA